MNSLTLNIPEMPYEIAEEIKTLRTNVLFSGDDKRVILLTSCLSGEGKSTTSLRLALSLSELDKNVLLIDADLRRSTFKSRILDSTADVGLSHYLSGQCPVNDAIYRTNYNGLYVCPAGTVPPNPVELLSNDKMQHLVQSGRGVYDYIIVDCAPLGMVTDAAVLAQLCDGSILLIESGTIHRRFAAEVLDSLTRTQCPVIGAVLNKVNVKKSGYYGRYYGAYRKYEKQY